MLTLRQLSDFGFKFMAISESELELVKVDGKWDFRVLGLNLSKEKYDVVDFYGCHDLQTERLEKIHSLKALKLAIKRWKTEST